MPNRTSEPFEVQAIVFRKTEKALFVSETDDESRAVWIPLSQISDLQWKSPRVVEFTLPEWLAEEKGFV